MSPAMKRRQLCGLLLLGAGCFAPEPVVVPEEGASEDSSSGAVGTLGAEGPPDPSTGGEDHATTGDLDETTGSSGEPPGSSDDTDDTADETNGDPSDDTTGDTTGSACAPAVFDRVDFDAACFQ